MSESSIKSGTKVAFNLGEVVCPDIEQVLSQVTRDLEVSGEVAFFSDYGDKKQHFAIVDVNGVLSPLIVPVAQLRSVDEAEEHHEARA